MDEISKMYDSQVRNLLKVMDGYSAEMEEVSGEIEVKRKIYNTGGFVNYKEFTTLQHKLRILSKKIKETASTIAYLSDKIEYDIEDFAGDVSMVRLRAEVTDSSLPQSVLTGEPVSWSMTIQNVGFSEWDSANAYLKIRIVKEDIFFDETYIFNINVGEVILLGESKMFDIQIPAFQDDGVYDVVTHMANDEYDFDRKYQYKLYVTN